jgi:serine/threonine protein kinase
MPTGSCNIYPILVMELACPSHPTLDQLVYMKVSLNLRLSLLRDVLEGVSVLHKLLVVHGDIKPENILLFEGGVGRLTAKVSDFGFSQSDSHPRWTGQEAGGTEYWNAPECLHTATESLRTFSKLNHRDIYSFGLLTCFVLLEELPFDEQGWGAKELSAEKLGGQIGKAMISRWRSTKSGQAKQTYGILDFNGIETDELNVSCSMPLKLSCE